MKVGYISDDIYLKHDTGKIHPESTERLVAINEEITSLEDKLVLLKPIKATSQTVGLVHPPQYILTLKDVPYIFMLEGGYDVDALAQSVLVTVEEMLESKKIS